MAGAVFQLLVNNLGLGEAGCGPARFGVAGEVALGLAGRGIEWNGPAGGARLGWEWRAQVTHGMGCNTRRIMKINRRADFIEELKRRNGGLITPELLVKHSKPKTSPTHNDFEWDDTKAGHNYRLWQARKIISVFVTMVQSDSGPVSTRAYVSLSTDRVRGGYRSIGEILDNESLRNQLLVDALSELRAIQKKYAAIQELTGVFKEVSKAIKKHQPKELVEA